MQLAAQSCPRASASLSPPDAAFFWKEVDECRTKASFYDPIPRGLSVCWMQESVQPSGAAALSSAFWPRQGYLLRGCDSLITVLIRADYNFSIKKLLFWEVTFSMSSLVFKHLSLPGPSVCARRQQQSTAPRSWAGGRAAGMLKSKFFVVQFPVPR